MDQSEIYRALERSEFFRGLQKSDIEKIAGLCHVKSYEPGQYIFQQGEGGENILVIAEGKVALERTVELGSRKGTVLIGILGKGRLFGCWSTLIGEQHNFLSSASCQLPTKVLVLKGADVRRVMLENTALGFRVLERLCFVLRDRIQAAYGAMEKI
jgi:CRP/FNR family transcriptional regulator, cyclic AMP receptor protein